MLKSRRLNQSLLESSTDCIKFLDLAARLLFMNGLGCKALEIDDFALVANAYWPGFWKSPFADIALVAVETAKAGGIGHFQGYCPTFKGTPKWWDVVITPLLDSHGKPEQLLVVSRDITGHKLIEERLRASEVQLRESEACLKNAERLAHIGHWNWNIKTNHVYWSEELYRILGRPVDSKPASPDFLRQIPRQDRDRVGQWLRECLAEKRGKPVECRVFRSDGELRVVACVSEVSLDEQGSPVAMFGTVQDITEVRHAQEKSLSMQRLESLGAVAGGIAHDFNNILGGVLTLAELALAERDSGSYPEEELTSICNAAMRGAEIVEQLMIYAGKENEVSQSVDVSQIVKEMIELLKVSVSKHATLALDLGQDLPAARGSPAKFRQVVMNLVTNASDAIAQNGVIRVTTSRVKADRRSSGAVPDRLAEGDYVQLEVNDTGCGMSRETQARILDPFFTTKPMGHGLGLSVVDGIVRGLGGAIHLTSELGEGHHVSDIASLRRNHDWHNL